MVSVVMWFLRAKDAQQQKELNDLRAAFNEKCEFMQRQVALLFAKHDDDATRLDQFQLKIASDHYVKHELDQRFDKLEAAFSKGFSELGSKFDRLSDRLLENHNGNGK